MNPNLNRNPNPNLNGPAIAESALAGQGGES